MLKFLISFGEDWYSIGMFALILTSGGCPMIVTGAIIIAFLLMVYFLVDGGKL